MHRDKDDLVHETHYRRDFVTYDQQLLDGDCFLHALNGFLMILDCNGELFFATHSIETYLGFHQSDVIHQSVYELVHSEDREELQRQLIWNTFLGNEDSGLSLQDLLQQENSQHLERSFTVRFRCLLDNTSGFLVRIRSPNCLCTALKHLNFLYSGSIFEAELKCCTGRIKRAKSLLWLSSAFAHLSDRLLFWSYLRKKSLFALNIN